MVQEQCSPAVPLIALSPSSQSSDPGQSLSYTVTLSNRDNTNCGSTIFTLSDAVPSGWTGSLSPSSLNLDAGQTGSVTLTVTSAAAAASGSYGLDVNVTGSETVHSVADTAEYIVADQCSMYVPELSLTPSTQSGYPGTTLIYTVSLSNRDNPACNGSTFSMTPSLPAGWSGTVVPASVTLVPGASASASLTVTSMDTTTSGAYSVRVDIGGAAAHETGLSAVYVVNEVIVKPPADSVPPTAPGALQVDIKRKSNNLSWASASDNVGVAGYLVWRDGVMIADITTTSYSDRSIIPGTVYSYWISAYDAAGNESDSSKSVDTEPVISTKPPKKK